MEEDTMDVVISPAEEADEREDLLPLSDDDDDIRPDHELATRRVGAVRRDEFLYIGQALTADEFTRYVQSYNFGSSLPTFVVVHHTAIPYTRAAPAPGRALSDAWDAGEQGLSQAQIKERRLRKVYNMKEYYRTWLLWDRGPHLFVDDRYIYLFTPMQVPGIHARQGNQYKDPNGRLHYSIGIEVVGHYTNVKWPAPVARLVGHTIAVLKKRLNTFELVYKWGAGGISGHREYNKPACPGDAITNDYIVKVAKEGWQRLHLQSRPVSRGLRLDSPIIGPPSGSQAQVAAYLKRTLPANSEYKNAVELILSYYWKYAPQVGVDPYLAAVQSIYETNSWRAFWAGRPRRNPAHLGVISQAQGLSFKSWNLSVQAHIGQLLALARRDEECNQAQLRMIRQYPLHYTIIGRGSVKRLRDLNRNWNNRSDYANKLLLKAKEIAA